LRVEARSFDINDYGKVASKSVFQFVRVANVTHKVL